MLATNLATVKIDTPAFRSVSHSRNGRAGDSIYIRGATTMVAPDTLKEELVSPRQG